MLRLRSHGVKHDKKHNALTFCEHPRIDYHLPGQYIDFPFDIARILLLKIGRASGTAPSEKSSNPKPPSGGIFLSVMQRERRSLRPGHSCPLADTPRWRRRRRASGRVGDARRGGSTATPTTRRLSGTRAPPISYLVICMISNYKLEAQNIQLTISKTQVDCCLHFFRILRDIHLCTHNCDTDFFSGFYDFFWLSFIAKSTHRTYNHKPTTTSSHMESFISFKELI